MKKRKFEKGITLIALIITIVVLLILAVVTIGAIQESKIIAHAKNAASDYKTKADEENTILDGYLATIEENLPGNNPPAEEEILWAFLDFGDEGKDLYFIGNVDELDLSQDKEVKAYVAIFNDDTEEIEYDENCEITTVRLSDTAVYLEYENTSIQRLILGAEIYACLQNDFNDLNSKIVIFESGITALNKLFDNGNSFLETIEIPATVTRINGCFYRCTNLTNITIKQEEGALDLSNSGLTDEQIANIVWAPEE